MRMPRISGRIRAEDVAVAPARLLRATYTQVGRVLMTADDIGRTARPDGPPADSAGRKDSAGREDSAQEAGT